MRCFILLLLSLILFTGCDDSTGSSGNGDINSNSSFPYDGEFILVYYESDGIGIDSIINSWESVVDATDLDYVYDSLQMHVALDISKSQIMYYKKYRDSVALTNEIRAVIEHRIKNEDYLSSAYDFTYFDVQIENLKVTKSSDTVILSYNTEIKCKYEYFENEFFSKTTFTGNEKIKEKYLPYSGALPPVNWE